MKYLSLSSFDTKTKACEFAKSLRGGDIVALYGNLGAGKTTFVKGMASGLGIAKRLISPTFILIRTYDVKNNKKGIKRLYHLDLYRLENDKDFKSLGLEELLEDSHSVIAIEWAEKMKNALPKKRWEILFNDIDEKKRELTIQKAS